MKCNERCQDSLNDYFPCRRALHQTGSMSNDSYNLYAQGQAYQTVIDSGSGQKYERETELE